jgi:hypothetical protein
MHLLQQVLCAWQLILHLLVILLILHLHLHLPKAAHEQLRWLEQTPLVIHVPILPAP